MEGPFGALTLHWWEMVCASGLGGIWDYLTHTRSRALACQGWRAPGDNQVQFLQGAEGMTEAQRGDKTCQLVAELGTRL